MKNKVLLGTLAAAVAVPAFVYNIPTEAATSTFSDISSTHPHLSKIESLVSAGVIAGYPDGTFRASAQVTRGQYAAFIARALKLPAPSKNVKFSDVSTNVTTYDGIIKAAGAGIVSGYPDGKFKPNDFISRSDMAIMLDRALQTKGDYTQKATLTYSDKGSIGVSAKTAIERLTYYKIMAALSGSSFSPSTKGDRLQTVLSIYQLLETQKAGNGEIVYPAEDLRNATYAELKAEVGTWNIWRRQADGSVYKEDLVQEMYENINAGTLTDKDLQLSAKDFFELRFSSILTNAYSPYFEAYPNYEIISVNGVAFRHTEWYPKQYVNSPYMMDQWMDNIIPNPPKESGKFLIDIPSSNLDVVTYESTNIETTNLSKKVEKAPNANDYYVDSVALFKGTDLVTVSNNGLTIAYNGQVLKMVAGSSQAQLNGASINLSNAVKAGSATSYIPFKSVVKALGLDYRQMDLAQRFEVTNYETDNTLIGWEE